MEMWVIYERPRDFPNFFVVRRWFIRSDNGRLDPDRIALLANTLREARACIPEGLYRQPRFDGDDEKIVETWF